MNNDNNLIKPFNVVVGQKVNLDPSKGLVTPFVFTEDSDAIKVKKGFEEKIYLVLYVYLDSDDTGFKFCTGRTETYNFIKDIAGEIDVHESKVIVETVSILDALTVYQFIKVIQRNMEPDGFDIDDYAIGDNIEEIDDVEGITNTEAYQLWSNVINGKDDVEVVPQEYQYQKPEITEGENGELYV